MVTMTKVEVLTKLQEAVAKVAKEAAPLGLQAVKDQLEAYRAQSPEFAHIGEVHVTPLATPGYFHIRVGAMGFGGFMDEVQVTVHNPNLCMGTWEENLRLIEKMQDRYANVGRSMPHNCGQFMTDTIMNKIRKVTGYEGLTYGDIWVHSCETLDTAKNNGTHEGYVAFGHCSRSGEIAMNKYKDALALNPDI